MLLVVKLTRISSSLVLRDTKPMRCEGGQGSSSLTRRIHSLTVLHATAAGQSEEIRRLKGVIEGEILDRSPGVAWADGAQGGTTSLRQKLRQPCITARRVRTHPAYIYRVLVHGERWEAGRFTEPKPEAYNSARRLSSQNQWLVSTTRSEHSKRW